MKKDENVIIDDFTKFMRDLETKVKREEKKPTNKKTKEKTNKR